MLKNINIPKRNINLNKDFLKFNLLLHKFLFEKLKVHCILKQTFVVIN